MSVSKPKLTYWDIRALAEPIRLLLNYAGVDFIDNRIAFGDVSGGDFAKMAENWFPIKYSQGLDFPNLPFYEDEDVKMSQSLAILQHLGRKHKLYGDSLKEAATCDMVANMLMDLRWQAWLIYASPDFPKIKEDWQKTLPGRLAEVEKFLEGKQFVLGNKISYVDFLMYEFIEWFRVSSLEVFEKEEGLQNLQSFMKRIEALLQIKAYRESGRFKDWPFWGPFVYFGFSKDPNFKPMPASLKNWFAHYELDKF